MPEEPDVGETCGSRGDRSRSVGGMSGRRREASHRARSELYRLCTDIAEPPGGWFSVRDCAGRALRNVVAFYYLAVTHPASFFVFSCRFNRVWYSRVMGVVATVLFWPVWPAAVLAFTVALMVKDKVCGTKTWYDDNVFFTPPTSPVGSTLWAFHLEFSVYVGLFILCGNDKAAIDHSWYDEVTQKNFWRDHLVSVGARVPTELARWSAGGPCGWNTDGDVVGDVVIKLPDSYLGIGDTFLEVGVDGYDGTRDAVEKILKENYNDGRQGVLVLEWVRPAPGHEVHSLDVLTVARPDGSVELASCLYWGKCADGRSSHSARAGYVCDADSERILAPAAWYTALFKDEMRDEGAESDVRYGCGLALPGLGAVADCAVRAHASALREQPWLRMCGWDVLLAKQGPVFFEGNFASGRLPRRVFLTWTNMAYFLRTYRPVL